MIIVFMRHYRACPMSIRLDCMTEPFNYDVIILGGGCAGLSLAMQLAGYGTRCPKILILEQRTYYMNDRTWCFWDDGTAPFGSIANHRWKKIIVGENQQSEEYDCQSFSYSMLAADTYYQTALKTIATNQAIKLILGTCLVSKPVSHDDSWHIETDKEKFVGKIIIDTRPHIDLKRDKVMMWQSFLGHEVICDEAVFDPTRVVLMDFLKPNPNDIRFTYVLPTSPYHALIESTVFGEEALQLDDLTDDIDCAIKKYSQSHGYKIKRSEYGVLPMGIERDVIPTKKNYIQAGLTAGGARSSSGYAFQRIQAWAKLCAPFIIENGCGVAHPKDSIIQSSMDKLFLDVLRADPEQGSALFLALFRNANTENVIRFLSDRASLADYLHVILALPMAPFIQQLWRLACRRPLAIRVRK